MTKQEFTSLSVKIRGKLIALARRFNKATGIEGDAEDIAQEALMTLWQLSEKGYPIRDPEALAVVITKSRCIERYRRQHIRYESIDDQVFVSSYPASLSTDRMDIETIRSIVQKDLTDSQRQLLVLRNEKGLSLDEIAVVTGRPKASIKAAISMARRKMLEQLKKIK